MHERDVVVATEEIDDLLCLAGAQQAGVDKDAGQLVADRLVQQHRRDGGIDPAREAADDISIADLTTNFVVRLGAKPRHCPVAAAARNLMSEVAQQLGALGGMCHLGMKKGAVKAPVVVSDRGIGCGLARGDRTETRRQRVDPVAMAHPHLLAPPLGHSPSNSRQSSRMSIKARPNSWCSLNVTRLPSWPHRIHSGERGTIRSPAKAAPTVSRATAGRLRARGIWSL